MHIKLTTKWIFVYSDCLGHENGLSCIGIRAEPKTITENISSSEII